MTGSEPYVWTYVPEASLDKRSHVTVKVKSGDKDVCGLVALQPRECPFQDLVMDAKYHSRYVKHCNPSRIREFFGPEYVYYFQRSMAFHTHLRTSTDTIHPLCFA